MLIVGKEGLLTVCLTCILYIQNENKTTALCHLFSRSQTFLTDLNIYVCLSFLCVCFGCLHRHLCKWMLTSLESWPVDADEISLLSLKKVVQSLIR